MAAAFFISLFKLVLQNTALSENVKIKEWLEMASGDKRAGESCSKCTNCCRDRMLVNAYCICNINRSVMSNLPLPLADSR